MGFTATVRHVNTRTSAGHRVLAQVLPRLRRPGKGPADEEELRAAVVARHARQAPGGVRPLPSTVVPGLTRRFEVTADDSAGFRTWILTPRDRPATRTVLYLHGGSFMAGIDPFHLVWVARLSKATGARIVLPDYPLAPEHTWRDSWDQVVAMASRWTERAAGAGEASLVLAGDSAGGGYALSVAQGVRDAGGTLPGAMVLHAPWVDLSMSTYEETRAAAERDPWLDFDKADVYARWWAGSAEDLVRPEVSPALADLSGLPPALMFFGTRDLLLPGGRLLERRAAEAGWDLTSVVEPGLLHVYSLFPHFVTEAKQAFARTVDFLRHR